MNPLRKVARNSKRMQEPIGIRDSFLFFLKEYSEMSEKKTREIDRKMLKIQLGRNLMGSEIPKNAFWERGSNLRRLEKLEVFIMGRKRYEERKNRKNAQRSASFLLVPKHS